MGIKDIEINYCYEVWDVWYCVDIKSRIGFLTVLGVGV